jgi:hypothetical protein
MEFPTNSCVVLRYPPYSSWSLLSVIPGGTTRRRAGAGATGPSRNPGPHLLAPPNAISFL